METQNMEKLYHKIAQKISDMIPDKWDKVMLYAEVSDDSTEVYFYFNSANAEYIYSHNIPGVYQVSKQAYEEFLFELFELFEELRNEFKQQEQPLWTNLTLSLESNGNFKIDYDYEDILASPLFPTERQVVWKYKNLGLLPKGEGYQKFLQNYLDGKLE